MGFYEVFITDFVDYRGTDTNTILYTSVCIYANSYTHRLFFLFSYSQIFLGRVNNMISYDLHVYAHNYDNHK